MNKNKDQLLLDNIDIIKPIIKAKISKIKWLIAISGETINDLTEMAISHIWENMPNYDDEKYDFKVWASKVAIRKLIDQYKVRSYGENIVGLVGKTIIELQSESISILEENIVARLEKKLGNRKRAERIYLRYLFINKVLFSSLENNGAVNVNFDPTCIDKNFLEYEWRDFKEVFITKLYEAYKHKEITDIQLDAIVHIYLPLSEGKNASTYSELAVKYGQTEGRISQLLNEVRFKNKINKILKSIGFEN